MDKNLFLAVALSILVYVGWFTVMNRLYPPQHKPAAVPAAGPASAGKPAAAPAVEAREGPAPQEAPAKEPPAASSGNGLEGAIPFFVGRVELKVQPLGAAIASYRYPGPLGPVELVRTARPGFFATWPELSFKPVAGPGIVFEAAHPSGARIRKEFVFDPEKNLHKLRIAISNETRKPVSVPSWDVLIGPGLGTVANEEKENASQWRAAVLHPPQEGQTQPRLEEYKLKEDPRWREQAYKWAGVDNRYFLAAAAPAEGTFPRFWTGAEKSADGEKAPLLRIEAKPSAIEPGRSAEFEIPFYLGPKGYTHLGSLGLGLEKSVQFGWFDKIGRMALQVLYALHRFTGNYGWAIILMTIFLQVLLSPLTYKQMKSAAIMKKLQPELTRIQQKFAKDPQRLNQEMMGLYRRHGANPLGGCLPLLVQMPIFIALFNALRGAWELHGAGWIFWIKDLSAHDPYYVLPLIMGGVMFLQSRMNPVQAADPMQAKMFQYMPVIFTFMFLKFPAGLVLYWLTNSVLGLLQQMALMKRFK
ncbi:MAG: membrane protein insertase YidC [Elusimicrobia bacterium]|nr:membrane protein insertase YidC [Elusimicrobiota bacterium]